MPKAKKILLLGSTGSIGVQTLEVVEANRAVFSVVGLAACSQGAKAAEQALKTGARYLAIVSEQGALEAQNRLRGNPSIKLFQGPRAIEELLEEAQYELAVQAITGAAGLPTSLRVLEQGKTLALANKESLVLAGALLRKTVEMHGGRILPIDSEHSAIFQCLAHEKKQDIRKIYLTASGGPLLDRKLEEWDRISPEEALQHPNWSMGPRITIGSATMMNKTLEIIEAHHLFDLRPEQIEVVIHRQSIIHSMVEFVDGSMLAQLGVPDMRIPIHFALSYPNRIESPFHAFDLKRFRNLSFEAPDPKRYPLLSLGFDCIRQGGVSGAVLNAADETATQLFLEKTISFPEIFQIVSHVFENHRPIDTPSLQQILETDRWAREEAKRQIKVVS